jgi:predicted alpha/beta hydrolase
VHAAILPPHPRFEQRRKKDARCIACGALDALRPLLLETCMSLPANHAPRSPVLMLLPAMGVAARFYEPFTRTLERACGATVLTVDLPGQGSSPLRASAGHDYGYREVVEVFIPEAVRRAAADHPGRPLFLVGHSLGGQLGLLAAARLAHRLHGLVLIAAGTAHWRAWPRGSRWRAALTVHAIRIAAALLPWYPGDALGFGGNQPRRFMRDWSFNATGGRYRLEGSVLSPDDLEHALQSVRLPLLALSLHGDALAPPGALAELLAKLPNAEVTHEAIDGVAADSPWRRHFSWARRPTGVHERLAHWLSRLPSAGAPPAPGSVA